MAYDLWQARGRRRGDRGGTFCVGGELEPSRDDMASGIPTPHATSSAREWAAVEPLDLSVSACFSHKPSG